MQVRTYALAALLVGGIVSTPTDLGAAEQAPGDIFAVLTESSAQIDPVSLSYTWIPNELCIVQGAVMTPTGDLYATSYPHQGCPGPAPGAHGVYRIDTIAGVSIPVSTGGLFKSLVTGIDVAPNGDLLVATYDDSVSGGSIVRVNPITGGQTLVSSDFVLPFGVAVDQAGRIFVADRGTNTLSVIDPATNIRTLVSQDGLLAGLSQAGGLALAPDGTLYVGSSDAEADPFQALVARVDPQTGTQTLVSYGQRLNHTCESGVTDIAVEADGSLLVVGARSCYGVLRIDPITGVQTDIFNDASPIGGIAVAPTVTNPYGLLGPLSPYAPPDERQFKAGSTIPLLWQYTREGVVIDSSSYQPTLAANGPVPCGVTSDGIPVVVESPGNSGLGYDTASSTWQFNWKTSKGTDGCFNLVITQAALGVTRTFPIKIKK